LIFYLVAVPLIAALVVFVAPADNLRPPIVAVAGLAHLALAIRAIEAPEAGPELFSWMQLDPLGELILVVVSSLFSICALYAIGYLRMRADRPNRVFCTCLLIFLATSTVLTLSQHLALMWVAMEATTLSMALLIYFNHNARSLEATWKYLMVGSVGIALALLGSFFLAYSAFVTQRNTELLFGSLLSEAHHLSRPWLRSAFVLLLAGYGTKMGLAPFHTWKPDVYGEAPGVVGALLSGGMTSCAFLAILRVYRIVDAAGEGEFARGILLFFGLLSIAVAAVLMIGQRDFKRMLAYSSVEHVGILVLGIGIGGGAILGALLHVINNAFTKGVLFLSAGNIHRAFHSKSTTEVSGVLRRLPISGALFLAGFFAITGSPPFGPFVSIFSIFSAAIDRGRFAAAALFASLLVVVFFGMGATVLALVRGVGSEAIDPVREPVWRNLPIIAALVIVVAMGIAMPRAALDLVRRAAATLEVIR
jgi:hydrogenase-4 component F